MKILAVLFFPCFCLTTNAQSLKDMEAKLLTILNENRGMGVFAHTSDIGTTLFEYSSYIYYAHTLKGNTLNVDDSRRLIYSDGKVSEKLWNYRILYSNIKSFELKGPDNYAYSGSNEESVMSSMLVIKCTIEGEYKEIKIGLHPKANAKTIQELNRLLIEIKKRL